MRAGGCTVQQALTADAANVVKQAVSLARRRGHAQVTPLHVANTMLSASAGLFRTACLQSRSHPLQCRALELCFNVALNRLPASTSGPMLGSHQQHQHHPSISNALVAAFRRAQAHQRRGSIESQQQPLLAVKIELEQLIISILDDPSVSRVMREAGFSSTQVKSNVEQAVSLELCNNNNNNNTETQTSSKPKKDQLNIVNTSDQTKNNEDVLFVIDNMVTTHTKRSKSSVIVGESVAAMEGVVRRVMEKIDKGDVAEALRGVKFVNLSLVSFARLARDEVELKLEELRRLVNSYMAGGGVVLFLGDLKWTAEFRSSSGSADRRISNYYCPVEHVVMEIGKLLGRVGENKRFWLMGIATFQTYQTCKTGHLSLETVWGLTPLTIPSRSLRLSLISDSDERSGYSSKKGENGCGWLQIDLDGDDEEEKQLNCCPECSAKYESEARSLRNRTSSACNNSTSDQSSSTLPAWLQHYKNQNKPPSTTSNDQDCVSLKDLGKKWSSICSSIHRYHRQHHDYSEKTLTFSSVMSPSSTSPSNFSYQNNPYPVLHRNMSWPQHINHSWTSSEPSNVPESAGLRMYLPDQPPLFSSSTPTSACSSDVMEVEYVPRFKDLNADNLKTLCDALEKKVPSHTHIVPEIATAILRSRSGLVGRKEKHAQKEDTWLFFLGADVAAKEVVARELARLVFGSQSSFVSIALSSFSDQDVRNKRSRDERSCGYVERFADAVSENPHRVFFVEDVEQADWCSQVGFKRAVERGRVMNSSGEEVVLRDAIVVLSCERFSSRSRGCSPHRVMSSDEEDGKKGNYNASDQEKSPCVSLDLNMSIDGDSVEDCDLDRSIDDIGLVESVDAMVIFKF